jgi:hypothetical protein
VKGFHKKEVIIPYFLITARLMKRQYSQEKFEQQIGI